jgi:ATP11 protein
MLLSQFQAPRNFLMAYLEDYKMDPHSATPLITFSVFDDLSASKNMSLVRCDILNNNIQDDEARKVVQSVLDNYRKEDEFGIVQAFNERPNAFDIDDYVSRMNDRWKTEPPSVFPSSERV